MCEVRLLDSVRTCERERYDLQLLVIVIFWASCIHAVNNDDSNVNINRAN